VARDVLTQRLEDGGFSVFQARDGIDGFEKFRADLPDLVVTDIRMPNADGIELIRRIRNEAKSWVPIIVVTSHRAEEMADEIFQAGQGAATHFLNLRHDLERLVEIARDALGNGVGVQQIREQRRNLRFQEVRRALHQCNGVIAHMAVELGVDRKTVYYHLEKFGLFRS